MKTYKNNENNIKIRCQCQQDDKKLILAVLLDSWIYQNITRGTSAFLCDLVFLLCEGGIRWRLEDQKSWMGNISCLRSGNELDIHQPSSNRIFPLLSVCTACIEMKMRMSEEGGGWKFCLIPCHENICRAVLVVRREEGEFEIIVFDIISTLDLTLFLC